MPTRSSGNFRLRPRARLGLEALESRLLLDASAPCAPAQHQAGRSPALTSGPSPGGTAPSAGSSPAAHSPPPTYTYTFIVFAPTPPRPESGYGGPRQDSSFQQDDFRSPANASGGLRPEALRPQPTAGRSLPTEARDGAHDGTASASGTAKDLAAAAAQAATAAPTPRPASDGASGSSVVYAGLFSGVAAVTERLVVTTAALGSLALTPAVDWISHPRQGGEDLTLAAPGAGSVKEPRQSPLEGAEDEVPLDAEAEARPIQGADLIAGGLPSGLAALERALRALTDPETPLGGPSPLSHRLGVACWVAAAALAYLAARRPGTRPALVVPDWQRHGGLGPLREELP